MKRTWMKRRAFLRGVTAAGTAACVALPGLDIMFNDNGDALAQGGALPNRFGVFYWGNGVRVPEWTPSSTGNGFALSQALQPLADLRDYFSVVSGMDIKTGNERGHHAGTVGILSGAPMISQDPMGAGFASTFSAPSIDQVVAGHIGDETIFRSIEYGISPQVVRSEGTTLQYLSHNGPDNANPPEYSPRALFNRLFGEGFVNPGEEPVDNPRLRLRRSLLDAVTEDARDLRRRLGRVDQLRLDQHLAGIRSLENKIAMLETQPLRPELASCMAPGTPAEDYDSDALAERSQVMSSLIAMAFACDQTRVFSNMFSGSVSGTRYPGTSEGHHGLTHDEGGDQPMIQAITQYIMGRFAELLTALRDVPEGDGNLLDHCVILASSDTSNARSHSSRDYPILVAGGGGGRLRTGTHYRSGGENTSRVLLSCLQAMGLPFDEFGDRGGHVSAACSQILM